MSWHADADLLERYVTGSLSDAAAWSLEAHVVECETCRTSLDGVAGEVTGPRLEATWSMVVSGVRRVERGRMERALWRLGVPEHVARLMVATPALTRSWVLAVVVTLGASVVLAWVAPGRSPLLFLLVAPLLPVAGVAASFGPRIDPAYEVAVVAAMSSFRLLLLRTVSVLSVSLLLGGAAAVAMPGAGWLMVSWLLPACALTGVLLAASTRWSPVRCGGVVAAGWGALVLVASTSARSWLVFGPTGQVLAATVIVVSGVVLVAGRERLEQAVLV